MRGKHLFLQDARRGAEFFDFRSPATTAELTDLEERLGGISLPPSFTAILEELGQGVFYNNESLLGVHETEEGMGDLLSVNDELHNKQGLPSDLIVFHLGTGGMHGFDTRSAGPEYAVVAIHEDTLKIVNQYDDFESWYREVLRDEYADLYGLDE